MLWKNGLLKNEIFSESYQSGLWNFPNVRRWNLLFHFESYKYHETWLFVFKSSFFITHFKSQTNYYCIVLAETYVATESLVLSKYYRGGNAKLDKKIGVKPWNLAVAVLL